MAGDGTEEIFFGGRWNGRNLAGARKSFGGSMSRVLAGDVKKFPFKVKFEKAVHSNFNPPAVVILSSLGSCAHLCLHDHAIAWQPLAIAAGINTTS